MFEELKKEFTLIRVLIILLIIALGIYLLGIIWQIVGIFSDVIIIFILAWLLSFILEPVVNKIEKLTRLSKTWSTLVSYLLFSLVFATAIFLLIPTITIQIQTLAKIMPTYLESAPSFVGKWGDTLLPYLNNSLSLLPSVAQFLFSLFIVLIISFYFIADENKINRELFYLVPQKWHEKLKFIQGVIDTTFASFLRVQLIFGIVSGIATWLVLVIFGIQFAAFSSVLSGILAIVPLVGPFLSIIPPLIIALIIDPAKAILIAIVLLVLQQFIFNVLGPRLLGRAFKLHPVIILISFLVGVKVAGPIGAIFAIPVLGVMAIVTREISHHLLKN